MKIKLRNSGNVFTQQSAQRKRLRQLWQAGMTEDRLREAGADPGLIAEFNKQLRKSRQLA